MAFSDTLTTILNHGAVNLALGLGYNLKIFDVLDARDTPVSIEELAKHCCLDPRYLKEWMGIMVTAGIILPAPEDPDTYTLPRKHGDLLCRRAGSGNMGVYFQEIPLLTACAMDAVKQGFKTGNGVPFSAYPDFQAFMTELADAKHEQVLVTEFLPGVNDGALVRDLDRGIRVCDLGCGQGTAVHLMAKAFPKSQFLGIDTHGQALAIARQRARHLNLTNTAFEELDAARLCENTALAQGFDWICAFDAIHDQSHPLQALEGVRHMLKPDGVFSMIDIKAGSAIADNMAHPMAPFLYTVSLMHCMPVGLNNQGRGLGMMWGEQNARDLLDQAGFSRVSVEQIPNDAFNIHFLCRP